MDKIYDRIRPMVLANLAEGASEQAMSKIETLINNAHTGAIGIGGFIALIFTSMTLLSDAEKALLAVWREKISRTLFQRFCTYWVFISLGPVALSVIVGAMSGTHLTVTRMLPSGTGLMLATTAFFFLVYKFIPKSKVNWNAALGGAICTASLWTGARGVYSIYVKNVVNYDKIYGSLGAIPIILVWIWMSWVIVLLGSSLAYSIQEYLKKQTHAR